MVTKALQQIGAPAKLVAWASSLTVQEAMDGCERADWLIWLAAVARHPLDEVLLASGEGVRLAAERIVDQRNSPIWTALSVALEGGSSDACAEAARACEGLARGSTAAYRQQHRGALTDVAHAAGWLAHAAEALSTASEREHAAQTQEALHRAVGIGVPPALMAPARSGMPPALHPILVATDPLHQELAFAVAAAARAIRYATRAWAACRKQSLRQAHEEMSDRMHEWLTIEP